jgi:hypothetical protein
MKRQAYYPSPLSDQAVWPSHLTTQLPGYAASLALAEIEVDNAAADHQHPVQRIPTGSRFRRWMSAAFFRACFAPVAFAGVRQRTMPRGARAAGFTFPRRRWR